MHKDITIGEQQYRVGQMRAADGSWIFSTFVKRYREFKMANPSESTEETESTEAVDPSVGFAMTAAFLTEQLSREELAEVQRLCLASCGRYSSKTGTLISMPILHSDGRYAIPELEYDGPTVLALTKESLAFNIAPFFPAAGSNASPAKVDSSQPSIQT
jgi:hypothetical protein